MCEVNRPNSTLVAGNQLFEFFEATGRGRVVCADYQPNTLANEKDKVGHVIKHQKTIRHSSNI